MIPNADAADALATLKSRQRDYRTFADYAAGKQPLSFSTDQWQTAFGSLFKRLSYNRCRAVVDAFANRLAVTGWESPDAGETDALGAAAMALWERTRMVRRQGELFAESLRSGDAYLIVSADDAGLARIDINRGHLIHPVYADDEPEKLAYAVKVWQIPYGADRGKWRITTYEPDVTTRLISRAKSDTYPEKLTAFVPYTDDGGAEIENTYGEVPVFHLGNNADTGCTGTSELVDVIPLQDGLNKSVADMLIAGEYVAFPQRWVVGAAPTTNPYTNEEEEQFKAAVDRVWGVSEPDAKFGQFDPADMTQYTNAQDSWDLKISRVSMVPVHWLSMTGDFPSGEALKTAEGPFVAKLKDRQTSFGDTLADAMAFALKVEGTAEAVVTPIWQAAESRSETEALNQALQKKALGVPDEQIWAELSYSADEIAQFTAAKQEAQQRQQEMFAQSFDRGQAPIGG